MIRKRNEIDLDIKARRANLGAAINNSIRTEKECEEEIIFHNRQLSELASETCFEDTFEGRIKALETIAFGKIDKILRELSETVGADYSDQLIKAGSVGGSPSSPPAPIFLTVDKTGGIS